MKKILVVMVCLFISASTCFSQPKYPVSAQTISEISQLEKYMDVYLRDALKDSAQFSSQSKNYLTQILNYIVIIRGKLDSLISILDSGSSSSRMEFSPDLTPKEVSKFIDYLIERIGMMEDNLNKHSEISNQALIIHHIEKIKDFIIQTKRLLILAQSELGLS
jgi:hypothetical protein